MHVTLLFDCASPLAFNLSQFKRVVRNIVIGCSMSIKIVSKSQTKDYLTMREPMSGTSEDTLSSDWFSSGASRTMFERKRQKISCTYLEGILISDVTFDENSRCDVTFSEISLHEKTHE